MQKFLVIFGLTLLCSASSYAIDQITLTTGELVEGKVLADVPNRHVDIELLNGEKRRYPKSQVANVERDVPSNKDRDAYGNDKRIFAGVLGGGLLSLNGGSNLEFFWGAKIGFNSAPGGSFQFAPALTYRRYSDSGSVVSVTQNYINAQFLLRRISNSGFYVGPQAGIAIASSTNNTTTVSASTTSLVAGVALGYDVQFSDSFSIGPDVVYDHFFKSGGGDTISIGLSAMFHFD